MALLCLIFTCIFTQNGLSQIQVGGQVRSAADNSPIAFANLHIQGLSNGAITDANGVYTIQFEKPGSYMIEVGAIGFKKQSVKFDLVENEQTELNILLVEDLINLETVIVSATRTLRSYEEIPAAVTVISAEQI